MEKYYVSLVIKNGKKQSKKVAKRATKNRKACEKFINDQAKQMFAESDDIIDCSYVKDWSFSYYLGQTKCSYYYHLEFIE